MGENGKRAKKINPIQAVMQSFSSSVVLCYLIFDELSCLLAQGLSISVSSNFDPKPRNTFIFLFIFPRQNERRSNSLSFSQGYFPIEDTSETSYNRLAISRRQNKISLDWI